MPNPDQDISGFAAKIEEYLTPLDLTLKTLAEDLAIHPSTLGYWIHGDSRKLKRGEKVSLNSEKVKLVIAALARREAIVTVAEALELLALALPDRPRLQKFNSSDQKTDWFRQLCASELDGATPYTAHRLPLRTEPKNGKSKATEDDSTSSKTNIAPLPPRSANELVGREREAEQLIEMLTYPDSATRLVTLKGMGGIGKTSLGLEVLHRLTGQSKVNPAFPDGITFVPLAEATSTGLLIAAMLQAVGMKPAASGNEVSPRARLTNFLASKTMLIMLDNFEQLIAVNTGSGELEENPRLFLSNLLAAAPGVKLLVTSQARLRIQGEQVFDVGFLKYPPLRVEVNETQVIQEYPAVKLFVEVANRENNNQVNNAFMLTSENVRDVCTICYYLNGIPLAITLAASRVREFKPDVMLAAFLARAGTGDGNFTSKRRNIMELLAQGTGYLPQRHQKMENTLGWSYEWLSEKEQMVFRRLSVFEGGFGIEAVAGVCAGMGIIAAGEVGQILSSLVSKSLVEPVSNGSEVRYALLVTLQDYGLHLLVKTGELEQIREQHSNWALELAREAEPHLSAVSRASWQEKLKLEYANLTAALGWLVVNGKAGQATEFAAILGNFAVNADSNYRNETKIWLQRVLGLRTEIAQSKKSKSWIKPEIRAKALHQAGRIAVSEKSWAVARNYFEQAISLWRETNNLQGLGLSLIGLGNIVYFQLNNTTALAYYIEAEKLARQTGDNYALVAVLGSLANIALATQDYKNAQNRYREVIRLKNLAGDLVGMAISMKNLATALIKERKFEEARQFSKESLELNNNLARQAENVGNLYNLGEIEQHQSNLEEAKIYYLQSLKLAIETTNFYYVPVTLNKFATILLFHQKELFAMAKIYGAIEKIIENSPDREKPQKLLLCA